MKQLRTRLHPPLTAQDVAEELGISVSTVSNWDTGRYRPRLVPSQMMKLLELYQCTLSELVEACESTETEQS